MCSVFQCVSWCVSAQLQDWYSELSGGQRSKAELMRQVFLKDRCPQASMNAGTVAEHHQDHDNICGIILILTWMREAATLF